MAVEPERLCGFRKVGGLYLVGDGPFAACHRLPLPVVACPACGQGVKQARGFTWVNAPALLHPCPARPCPCRRCAICQPELLGVCGLLWVGEAHYGRPRDFLDEAERLGISKRISVVPRGFEVGRTWVLLAHPKAIEETLVVCKDGKLFDSKFTPGIVTAFIPQRVELLLDRARGNPRAAAGAPPAWHHAGGGAR